MWETKIFKTERKARAWMDKNRTRFYCELFLVNDGWGVEFRRKRGGAQ